MIQFKGRAADAHLQLAEIFQLDLRPKGSHLRELFRAQHAHRLQDRQRHAVAGPVGRVAVTDLDGDADAR